MIDLLKSKISEMTFDDAFSFVHTVIAQIETAQRINENARLSKADQITSMKSKINKIEHTIALKEAEKREIQERQRKLEMFKRNLRECESLTSFIQHNL